MSEDIKHFYEMGFPREEPIKGFKTIGKTFDFKFKNLADGNLAVIGPWAFDSVLIDLSEGVGEDDRVGVCIKHPALNTDILIPFRRPDLLNGESIMAQIEKVSQSSKDFEMDSLMKITFTVAYKPEGQGKNQYRRMCWEPWLQQHSVVMVDALFLFQRQMGTVWEDQW